jgi:hypothetical protein
MLATVSSPFRYQRCDHPPPPPTLQVIFSRTTAAQVVRSRGMLSRQRERPHPRNEFELGLLPLSGLWYLCAPVGDPTTASGGSKSFARGSDAADRALTMQGELSFDAPLVPYDLWSTDGMSSFVATTEHLHTRLRLRRRSNRERLSAATARPALDVRAVLGFERQDRLIHLRPGGDLITRRGRPALRSESGRSAVVSQRRRSCVVRFGVLDSV